MFRLIIDKSLTLLLLLLLSLPAGMVGIAGTADRATAQTIPVGDLREQQLRIQQLLNDSLSTSFVNRPVWNGIYNAYMDDAAGQPGWWNRRLTTPEYELDERFRAGIFEPEIGMTTNSSLAIGQNNGAAWYGRGFNTEFQGGFYITSDYLTAAFRPHIIWQQNTDIVTPRFLPRDSDGNVRYVSETIPDRIDKPFRFGPDPFTTLSPGHSSVRFHYEAIEAGISTEPLWWGGSPLYPLVMSNNAPGVLHSFIGTRSPLTIPYVGDFEFRWMLGYPQDSDYFDLGEDYEKTRVMNALNISYSPEFIPGLHLGLTRVYHFYRDEGGLTGEDLFVIFDPFQKKKLIENRGEDSERKPRNQLASVYARWVWPEQHMEIFGEYFRDDHSWDWRDYFMEPMHNSGYSFGFQNLVFLPDAGVLEQIDFLKFHLEFTQMSPGRLDEIRAQTFFYSHSEIRQGHTNRGQVMGAAIGPGSNSTFLGIDGYSGDTTVGLFLQRWVNNDHFHYEYNQPRGPRFFGDKWRHPVNVNVGTRFVYGPGPWYLSGSITWTKAYNFGRFYYGFYDGVDWDTRTYDDEHNIQLQITLRHIF